MTAADLSATMATAAEAADLIRILVSIRYRPLTFFDVVWVIGAESSPSSVFVSNLSGYLK